MATATLNKNRVTSARVNIPAWGIWYADASVDGAVTLSGAAELKIADLTLTGTILNGGPDDKSGRSHYRIVGGKGGWGRELPPKGEANDAGVKVLQAITDAARAVGETLDTSTISSSERTGPHYVRPEGPASRVLQVLKPEGWYVDETGTTKIGARATTTPSVKKSVMKVDKARGTVELAAESIASLLPGAVVEGVTAVDVKHEISDKGLRTTLWGKQGGTTSRRLEAQRAIFEQLFPALKFGGVYEYRVVLLAGQRVSLQPVRVATGMPDLLRVPIRPGVSGMKSTLVPGCRVLVAFVDADPGHPMVIAHEDSEGDGFLPLITEIDAQTLVKIGAGLLPAIKSGDLAGGIWPCIPTQVKVLI
jgi:hypothetical protein